MYAYVLVGVFRANLIHRFGEEADLGSYEAKVGRILRMDG